MILGIVSHFEEQKKKIEEKKTNKKTSPFLLPSQTKTELTGSPCSVITIGESCWASASWTRTHWTTARRKYCTARGWIHNGNLYEGNRGSGQERESRRTGTWARSFSWATSPTHLPAETMIETARWKTSAPSAASNLPAREFSEATISWGCLDCCWLANWMWTRWISRPRAPAWLVSETRKVW